VAGTLTDNGTMDLVRDKATRLFQFVQAFNERRNPPVRDIRKYEWLLWLKDVPSYESIELVSSVDESDDESEQADAGDGGDAERVILRCSRG
jgi:hypothetical protein